MPTRITAAGSEENIAITSTNDQGSMETSESRLNPLPPTGLDYTAQMLRKTLAQPIRE
jgi:hypothetical protein